MVKFPLSARTQEIFAELMRLGEIRADFEASEAASKAALARLQKKRIDALVSPGNVAGAADIEGAIKGERERILDAQSTIEGCSAKRKELISQALASMKRDQAARLEEINSELKGLRSEEERLLRNCISTLALAGAAQMRLKGFWAGMVQEGPGLPLSRLSEEHQAFWRSELSRCCDEVGVDDSMRPMAETTKVRENYYNELRGVLSTADVERLIAESNTQPIQNN